MADVQAHLRQYWHNRSLIPRLPATHADWVATVTFYCAVQLIDAVLAKSGVHPIEHKMRNEILAKTNSLKLIAEKYDPLYLLARKVRYFADPTLWVPSDRLDKELFRRNLYPLEHSAYALLKLSDPHIPITLPTS